MQFLTSQFITSMARYQPEAVEDLPQVAVVGKSNVGKSSLINGLCRNGKLCKVGKTPGKTRLINWFLIDSSAYLVDLPGYGYAKRSKEEIASWGKMMDSYFEDNERLKCVILLLDIRHQPTKDDRMMYEWVIHYGLNLLLLCTKADKVAKSKRKPRCMEIASDLGFDGSILPVDSYSGYGRDAVLQALQAY